MNNIKKIISALLVFGALFVLCSCSFDAGKMSNNMEDSDIEDEHYQDFGDEEYIEEETTVVTTTAATTTVTTTTEPFITSKKLEEMIKNQDVRVVSTELIIQEESYGGKAAYPDLLSAVVRNDSDYDLKNVVVAYVAWDKNNLPVKIAEQWEFDGGAYIAACNFSDANIVPGSEYGKGAGFALSRDCRTLHQFKAIVVSFETFEGGTWANPYYNDWVKLYAGKRLEK